MLHRLSTTQRKLNRVSSNPGDVLYDQKKKHMLVSEYNGIGKTALLRMFTDLATKGMNVVEAKEREYPALDVPDTTPAETAPVNCYAHSSLPSR